MYACVGVHECAHMCTTRFPHTCTSTLTLSHTPVRSLSFLHTHTRADKCTLSHRLGFIATGDSDEDDNAQLQDLVRDWHPGCDDTLAWRHAAGVCVCVPAPICHSSSVSLLLFLFLCLSMYVSLLVPLSLPLFVSVCLSLLLRVCLCLSVAVCLSLSLCFSMFLSLSLFLWLPLPHTPQQHDVKGGCCHAPTHYPDRGRAHCTGVRACVCACVWVSFTSGTLYRQETEKRRETHRQKKRKTVCATCSCARRRRWRSGSRCN